MNLNELVVTHLNINLIRNKFEALLKNVSGEVNLLMISETKIDESFPKRQFLIKALVILFVKTEMFMTEVLIVC